MQQRVNVTFSAGQWNRVKEHAEAHNMEWLPNARLVVALTMLSVDPKEREHSPVAVAKAHPKWRKRTQPSSAKATE